MKRRELVGAATRRLAEAGVASPEHDATELLAHVLGRPRGELVLVEEIDPDQQAAYDALVTRRAAREPLQHLTGAAHFRHVELAVGPGVFVPRPETELLAGWAIGECLRRLDTPAARGLDTPAARSSPPPLDLLRTSPPATRRTSEQARRVARSEERAEGVSRRREWPVVVDLCTGSGAIAKAIADEVPEAQVHAVELSPEALGWAERNLAGTGVDLRSGDFTTAFDDLLGTVDVVVCNPPYVPLEAWESVAVEARDHDPHLALFSGQDGLAAIRALETRAAQLLRPGGVVGFEHADVQGEAAPAVFAKTGRWAEVRDHDDLAGRPRFTTARLAT